MPQVAQCIHNKICRTDFSPFFYFTTSVKNNLICVKFLKMFYTTKVFKTFVVFLKVFTSIFGFEKPKSHNLNREKKEYFIKKYSFFFIDSIVI